MQTSYQDYLERTRTQEARDRRRFTGEEAATVAYSADSGWPVNLQSKPRPETRFQYHWRVAPMNFQIGDDPYPMSPVAAKLLRQFVDDIQKIAAQISEAFATPPDFDRCYPTQGFNASQTFKPRGYRQQVPSPTGGRRRGRMGRSRRT